MAGYLVQRHHTMDLGDATAAATLASPIFGCGRPEPLGHTPCCSCSRAPATHAAYHAHRRPGRVSKWTVGTREKEKEEDEPGRMTAGLAAAKAEAPPGTVDEGVEDRGAGACRCRTGAGTGAGCDAEWFRDAMVLSWKERDEGGGGARLGTRDGRWRRVLPCDAPPPSLGFFTFLPL
jgi:hypothetical protein